LHVFDNGNFRGAALCNLIGRQEHDAPVSVDGAAVTSGDELVGSLSCESVQVLVVVIDNKLRNGLPCQRIALCIIAQRKVPCRCLVV
jgi:hypothetical protein